MIVYLPTMPSTTDRLPAPLPPEPVVAEPPSTKRRSVAAKRGWRQIDAPLPAEVADVDGRFLYVAEQGTVLRRSGSRIVVTRKDERLIEVPITRLQGAVIYGNVQVSTQCLRTLLADGVWLSFFGRGGQYRGRMQPPAERGGRLRRRQWERASDPAFCLEFARTVVRRKIECAIDNARRYAKNRPADSLGTGQMRLRESLSKIGNVQDLDALRGVEGAASRAYFDLFSRWNTSDLAFRGREKRGTSNPLNALLNFGYALLTRELEGLLESAGLDPTVGFYHQPDGDRPSLACDWVEEFRHVVVDRLVLTLVNRQMLTAAHFEDGADHRGVRMTAEGLRVFSGAYEKLMRRPQATEAGGSVGVRSQLLRQLGVLLDALAGRGPYEAVVASESMAGEPGTAAVAEG